MMRIMGSLENQKQWRKLNVQTENLISIVIPAYNVSKYLRQCLSSIFAPKRKKNYQIIIVNDGSTDDTGKICEEYQKE